MTRARVQYKLNPDETLQVEVETDANHPDALTDAVARVSDLYLRTISDLFATTRTIETERERMGEE